ncbi:hypothetical protein BCV70DRAFT_13751 [Testicularia cyperi]|uniref:Uncharacterized protein n=1 Tax=Testicularia cyperi TaxID=1882483 RepID=A0A317XY64_9BASI|nr:hypothetical protein BCV70DRAFT_13751 [Testicularia cyperi]
MNDSNGVGRLPACRPFGWWARLPMLLWCFIRHLLVVVSRCRISVIVTLAKLPVLYTVYYVFAQSILIQLCTLFWPAVSSCAFLGGCCIRIKDSIGARSQHYGSSLTLCNFTMTDRRVPVQAKRATNVGEIRVSVSPPPGGGAHAFARIALVNIQLRCSLAQPSSRC